VDKTSKLWTFKFPEADVAELESMSMQVQQANTQMRRDQMEIEVLKATTQRIAADTRGVLDQLEAIVW